MLQLTSRCDFRPSTFEADEAERISIILFLIAVFYNIEYYVE
jgi:hypothetical protein